MPHPEFKVRLQNQTAVKSIKDRLHQGHKVRPLELKVQSNLKMKNYGFKK